MQSIYVSVRQSEDAKKIIRNYNKMAAVLMEYEVQSTLPAYFHQSLFDHTATTALKPHH